MFLFLCNKSILSQISLFNAGMGLGSSEVDGTWRDVLLATTKGVPDQLTDIPPALATMKIIVPTAATGYYLPKAIRV